MTKSKGKSDPIEQAMQDALESVERIEKEGEIVDVEIEGDGEDNAELESNEHVDTADAEEEAKEDVEAKLKEQLLRMAADFENFRKRSRREQEDLRKFGVERLVVELLPVVDNLERALMHAEDNKDPVVEGVRMVAKQFAATLGNYGVTNFESVGQPFDPERHEAVSQVSDSGQAPGSIVEEFQRGYLLHDRLLRPAKVIVASEPAVEEDTESDE